MSARDEVAEAFALRSARAEKNFFSSGDKVFSYGDHYIVGYWQDGTVFVNEESNSRTTAQHVGAVKRALASHNRKPTDTLVTGPNGHTYREWQFSQSRVSSY